MSIFTIQINFSKNKIPQEALMNVSKIIADNLKQSVEEICGGVIENTHLVWRGSTDPAIFIVIQSVCKLNAEINNNCARAVSEYLENLTLIPSDRIFISFTRKVISDVAVNGKLLHQYS